MAVSSDRIIQLEREISHLQKENAALKDTDRALRESREKYRAMIQNLMEGFCSVSLEGVLLEYNQEFLNILKLDPKKDHTGIDLTRFWVDEKDQERFVEEIVQTGFVQNYEVQISDFDGKELILRVNARAIRDQSGAVSRVEVSFLDDTNRKRAEEKLQESEAKFRLIANNSVDCIWQLDRRLRFTYLSPSLEDITGHPPEKWLGTRLLQHTTNKESAKIRKYCWNLLNHPQTNSYISFETKMYNRQGELIPLEIVAKPLLICGELIGLQGSMRDIQNRTEAEKRLRENEQFLKDVLEAIPDGFSILDPEGAHLDVNPALCVMTGFSKDELIGVSPPHPYWPEEEYDSIQEALTQSAQGDLKNHQLVFKRKSGERLPVIVNPAQIFDEDGELRNIIATVVDITPIMNAKAALLRAKEEAERNQAYFQTLIQKSPLPMVITDENQDVEFFNEKFTQEFGYTRAEVSTAEDWWQLAYPDPEYRQKVSDKWLRAIEDALRNKTDIAMQEWEIVNKDGAKRQCEFYMVPLGKKNLIVMQDVTERKKAEEALKKSERKFATLIANLQGMVYRCRNDPQWTMEFVNEEAEDLTGYLPEELLHNRSTSFNDLIHPQDRERVWETVQNALTKGSSYQLEYRIITKDGSEKWVWEKGQGIYSENGEVQALEGFITDITERVQAETELREMKQRLETEVAEKTKELQNRVAELERYYQATINREFRLKELKDEVERLRSESSE